MTMTKEIRFRVSRNQYERIRIAAEGKGRSISQYMRDVALKYELVVIQRITETNELVKEIHKIIKPAKIR